MLSLKRSDFIELIVPILATLISTYLFCYSILGLYDEVVLALISCLSIDLEQNNGKIRYGSPELHKLLGKVYDCHEIEKKKYETKKDKRYAFAKAK